MLELRAKPSQDSLLGAWMQGLAGATALEELVLWGMALLPSADLSLLCTLSSLTKLVLPCWSRFRPEMWDIVGFMQAALPGLAVAVEGQ